MILPFLRKWIVDKRNLDYADNCTMSKPNFVDKGALNIT